jgi:hypothetical protein
MPDELITVSATQVLNQVRDSLGSAQQKLNNTIDEIESFLRPKTPQPIADTTHEQFITQRESDLLKLRGDIESALGALRMLQVLPARSMGSRKSEDDVAELMRSEPDTSVAVAGVSATTVHRMSEIGESLKLSRQQTLERCVATQNYVDSKLREGWQFFIKRGRERRAVSFPGQFTV